MLRQDTRVIDGVTYKLTQMQAMRALKLLPRLGSILGPVFSKFKEIDVKALKTQGLNADINPAIVGDAIIALTEKLTENELEAMVKDLLYSLIRDDVPCDPGPTSPFQLLMAGQTLTIFKLLRFALELNYGDFFGVAGRATNVLLHPAVLSSKE